MKLFLSILLILNFIFSQKLLIPMDNAQSDHLKSYGLIYWALEKKIDVEWLLNYRDGSFLINANNQLANEALIRGISYELINTNSINEI